MKDLEDFECLMGLDTLEEYQVLESSTSLEPKHIALGGFEGFGGFGEFEWFGGFQGLVTHSYNINIL